MNKISFKPTFVKIMMTLFWKYWWPFVSVKWPDLQASVVPCRILYYTFSSYPILYTPTNLDVFLRWFLLHLRRWDSTLGLSKDTSFLAIKIASLWRLGTGLYHIWYNMYCSTIQYEWHIIQSKFTYPTIYLLKRCNLIVIGLQSCCSTVIRIMTSY